LPTLVIPIIALIRRVFVEILEGSPGVECEPKVVEGFDFGLGGGEGAEGRDGLTV